MIPRKKRRARVVALPQGEPGPGTICLILARVSSLTQKEKDTVAMQLHELPATANRKGWPILRTIVDEGISGTRLDRDGLQEALELAKAGAYQVLVVWDLKRIARTGDEGDFEVYLALKNAGVSIYTVNPPKFYDWSNPNDRLFMTLLRGMAGFDHSTLLANFRSGKIKGARAGRRLAGRDPYGLRWVRDPKSPRNSVGQFEIVPDEACIVRRIFDEVTYKGVAMIAYDLTQEGLMPRPVIWRTKRPDGTREEPRPGRWRAKTVQNMLRSPVYRGERIADFEGHDLIFQTVPAIVSDDVWHRAQAALSRRTVDRRARSDKSGEYLCLGLLRCGICDRSCSPVHASNACRRAYNYYRCRSVGAWRSMGLEGPCGMKHHRAKMVDERVWEIVQDVFSNAEKLERACKLNERPDEDWAAKKTAARGKANALTKHVDALLALHGRGTLKTEDLERHLKTTDHQRAKFDQEIAEADRQLASASAKREMKRSLSALVSEFSRKAKDTTLEQRRRLLRAYVSPEHGGCIVLHPGGLVEIRGTITVGDQLVPYQYPLAS